MKKWCMHICIYRERGFRNGWYSCKFVWKRVFLPQNYRLRFSSRILITKECGEYHRQISRAVNYYNKTFFNILYKYFSVIMERSVIILNYKFIYFLSWLLHSYSVAKTFKQGTINLLSFSPFISALAQYNGCVPVNLFGSVRLSALEKKVICLLSISLSRYSDPEYESERIIGGYRSLHGGHLVTAVFSFKGKGHSSVVCSQFPERRDV